MESTNFIVPYCPITQLYEPGQISELIIKEDGAHYRHPHPNFEDVANASLEITNLEIIVSVYANIKYDIDNLNKLLEDPSIKRRTELYFDLTRILSVDQHSKSILSSYIDLLPMEIINRMNSYPLLLLESEDNQGKRKEDVYFSTQESREGKEKENSPTPLSSTTAKICKIYQERNDLAINFTCVHSHSEKPVFKTYKQLCQLIIALKADLAYFNNIENSEEWTFYSKQSEEIKKLFQFKVEIEKNKDEIHLQIFEKVETAAKWLFIKTSLQRRRNQAAILPIRPISQVTPIAFPRPMPPPFTGISPLSKPQFNLDVNPQSIVDELNKLKSIDGIFNFIIKILKPVTPKEYSVNLHEVATLNPMSIYSFVNLVSLIQEMKKNTAYINLFQMLELYLNRTIQINLNILNSSTSTFQRIHNQSQMTVNTARNEKSLEESTNAKASKRKSREKPADVERKKSKTIDQNKTTSNSQSKENQDLSSPPVMNGTEKNPVEISFIEEMNANLNQKHNDEDWIDSMFLETNELDDQDVAG
jgi:hypothetical protein